MGGREAWLAACAFFTVKLVLAIIGRWNPYPEGVARSVIMMLIIVLLFRGVDSSWNSHPKVPKAEAQTYLDAQKWARDNTPQHALFMPDPAHTYGWKDYSRRASYGNIRDWTHSVIVYRSDALKFKEGIRRARRLGVDPELYLARADATGKLSPGSVEYAKMYQDIRSAYYQMSGVDLLNLARDEGINYFVFELKYTNLLKLKPVYQNAGFAICAPILQEYRVIAERTFPITLPSDPVLCERFLTPHYDWINRGSRGKIWLNRIDGESATLQLIAGAPDNKGEHIILLSPKAESEKGFPVVSGGQVVTFACDMRFAGSANSGGDVQLRLDVFSAKDGWSYHSRKIDVDKDWRHFEASVSLASNAVNVYPTLIWGPAFEGCALELRSPHIRWITIVGPTPR